MTRNIQIIFTRCFYFSCLGLLLVLTLAPYWSSYFYYDDFNCIFLAQQQTGWSILWHNLNPASTDFRPFYMLVYWVHWNLFGLSPLPYHLFAWLIHGFNLGLVYILLKRVTGSQYTAALACVLFAYQVAFREVFFDFACVGEVLSACLFFLGICTYICKRDSVKGMIWCFAIFLLAIRTKEIAITLPAVWLLYELVVQREIVSATVPGGDETVRKFSVQSLWSLTKRFALPIVVAAAYLLLRLPDMGGLVQPSLPYSPSHPYYMDYSPQVVVAGYAWYFNSLLRVQLSEPQWLLLWFLAIGVVVRMRNRWALFFLLYIFLTLIPIIPLVNRRLPYYWYIPFLGVVGLVALVVKRLSDWLDEKLSPRWAIAVGGIVFLTVACGQYVQQKKLTQVMMEWVNGLTSENRSFISGLQALPPPALNETIYFASVPRYFDAISTKAATQAVFRRTDLDAKIVEVFPPEATYCIRFEYSKVILAKNPERVETGNQLSWQAISH